MIESNTVHACAVLREDQWRWWVYVVLNSSSKLSGAVPSPIAGLLAAWMPPSSLHGRIHGVSRER
ncbi:hypothetical protein XcodCFBP4690_10550 [Xanthomonas codiaei]|uniref:Uncharacterized protein n=1 Tax=Xanthomonas codiaei TaxID=56463 RepID=A0A2S7CR59_9XANT|nr:hypothetical protein XcodCFBP4690_10550 [Xanthomonas codiaei]